MFWEERMKLRKALALRLGSSNPLAAPSFRAIVLSVGIGRLREDREKVAKISEGLAAISGQRPVATVARRSIAAFKVRRGQKVGLKVTLRGRRLYDFLERLVKVALPRMRDFRGVRPSFDRHGNLTIGLAESTIFPELPEGSDPFSMAITFVTTANEQASARALLESFGMPFAGRA